MDHFLNSNGSNTKLKKLQVYNKTKMINKMTLEPHGNNIELIFFLIVVKAQGEMYQVK